MLGRTRRPTHHKYHLYGARGIKVAKRWHDFKNFQKDMGKSFREGLTLDRINPNGPYSKSNTRWVSIKTQNNNRRNSKNSKKKRIAKAVRRKLKRK
jgi:hypothetical protein